MNDKIVYAWTDSGLPFYIGIGTTERSKCKRNRNRYCLNKRLKAERENCFEVEILYSGLSFEEACEIECKLIQQYGRLDTGTGILTNMTDGGDGIKGYSHTKETKRKLSKSLKGTREGKNNPNHRPVITPYGTFNSTSEASKIIGCNQSTVSRRALNVNFPDYKYI